MSGKKYWIINCLLFSTCSLFLIISCKKKNESTPKNDVLVSIPAKLNGYFEVCKLGILNYGNFQNLGISAQLGVLDTLTNPDEILFSEDVGHVSLNNITFQKVANQYDSTTIHYTYLDSTGTSFSMPFHWQVSGNGNIGAFSYTNSNGFPVFTAFQEIPDSISLSKDLLININGYFNADRIEVIFQGNNGAGLLSHKSVSSPATSITYSINELSILAVNSTCYMEILFYKNNYQTINGKIYNFRTIYELNKSPIFVTQ